MIIDGKQIAKEKAEALAIAVQKFKAQTGIVPSLTVILIGADKPSELYVSTKAKKAVEVGIKSDIIKLPENCPDKEVISRISQLNDDSGIHGILVQLPFPPQSPTDYNQRIVLDSIHPAKDVDCLTSSNLGLLAGGEPRFFPATVKAILIAISQAFNRDLFSQGISYRGIKYLLAEKQVTIIGRSLIVGKPLAAALINLGATVTICNSKTASLSKLTAQADILVSATGVPGLVTAGMVKPGAVVIDCGSPKAEVDFPNVSKVALAITPVPGGIGPLTVFSLLDNCFHACHDVR